MSCSLFDLPKYYFSLTMNITELAKPCFINLDKKEENMYAFRDIQTRIYYTLCFQGCYFFIVIYILIFSSFSKLI